MSRTRLTRRLFLSGSGALGLAVLAACGAPPTPTPEPPKPAPTTAPAAAAPTQPSAPPTAAPAAPTAAPTTPPANPTAVPTVAPTAAPAVAAPTTGPAAELLYYYGLRDVPKDNDLVQAEMNKIMRDRVGATIKLQPLEFGAYNDKMTAKNAAGEKYDLAYTASWINNYYTNVKNGVLLDLTDLLPKLAPKYYGGLNPAAWGAAKVNGRIYSAINQQIWASVIGPTTRKDLADKYKFDITKATKYEDLEPYFDAIVKGEASKVTPMRSDDGGGGVIWWGTYWGVDGLPGGGWVYMNDKDVKVQSELTLPEFKTCMDLTRKWYQAGYYTKEPVPAAEVEAAMKAGKYAATVHVMKPGGTAEDKAINGWDWVAKIFDKGYLTTGSITATLTGVSKKTSSPEASVKYLELINTDKPLYNLLVKGIEGKHWVWTNKEKEVIGFPPGITPQNSPYNPNVDWELGDQFNAYYVDEAQVGAWEATRKLNNAATPSPMIGFVPETEPVKNELAAITAALAEFKFLPLGLLDPAKALPSKEAKLKAAGIDKVLAEWQKQIEVWKATR